MNDPADIPGLGPPPRTPDECADRVREAHATAEAAVRQARLEVMRAAHAARLLCGARAEWEAWTWGLRHLLSRARLEHYADAWELSLASPAMERVAGERPDEAVEIARWLDGRNAPEEELERVASAPRRRRRAMALVEREAPAAPDRPPTLLRAGGAVLRVPGTRPGERAALLEAVEAVEASLAAAPRCSRTCTSRSR